MGHTGPGATRIQPDPDDLERSMIQAEGSILLAPGRRQALQSGASGRYAAEAAAIHLDQIALHQPVDEFGI